MKTITPSIFIVVVFVLQSCAVQIKNAKTESVKVYGNCNMCKNNIETAAYKKKVAVAVWNKENKTALLTYDSTQTTTDAILKKIALAGYDNQSYLAPDDVYANLDMCCQYERKKPLQQVNDTNTQASTQHDTTTKQFAQNPLATVYTTYFALKDALAKDNSSTAATKAKELSKAIDAVPMDKLTAAQHIVWMKYMQEISYNAEHIKGTTEIGHQREHFAKLSAAIIEVMKVIKPDYTVYIDHCPMYNNGKGADWLSTESIIKNPYYGSSMLTCGSTKQTITK